MRIWVVEHPSQTEEVSLRTLLRQIVNTSGEGHVIVGERADAGGLAGDVRSHHVDAVVIAEGAWPDETAAEILETEVSILLVTPVERCDRYQELAGSNSMWFLPPNPTPETLRLALRGLAACRRRQAQWREQTNALQQRLDDRIVIERAKGVLMQRLGISEEDAYKRLRLLSRRQRRQIRDIAQSLLDTQDLLSPQSNGDADFSDAAGPVTPARDDT
jgi:AmiR/NasT family two-component response regulator